MISPAEDRTLYHVVMVSFAGMDTAGKVVARLKADHGLDECEIEGEAVISRDAAGHIHHHERGAAMVGATFGGATAGIIGLVGGPVILLLMVVVGGVAGGLAGHFAGQVLPREDLDRVAESLAPGTSAYIAVVDAQHADALAAMFSSEGQLIVNAPVETELASALREAVTHSVTRV